MIQHIDKKFMEMPGHGLRLWLPLAEMDDPAKRQAANAARQPYVVDDIMIMPDAHSGYGLPIGGVMATDGSIVPYAVGMDIGCGMVACRLALRADDLRSRDIVQLRGDIQEVVPTGLGCRRKTPIAEHAMPAISSGGANICHHQFDSARWQYQFDSARWQLGTLGAGNHFLELQQDEHGYVWIMIHCGSRNLGGKVAKHYSDLAADLCSRWKSKADNKELAFFPRGTEEFSRYMGEMSYCVTFAKWNRMSILNATCNAIRKFMGLDSIHRDNLVDICHNFAAMEHHKGKNVMVHRKGACHVQRDRIGIIPGSMKSGGYIVKGLGNVQAYDSCSHGAGRTMSRKKAKETLDMDAEQAKLTGAGIHTKLVDISESDSAYKDLDIVIERQKDLIEIVHRLKPIFTVKGTTK